MKLQLDTTSKIIKIEESVNLNELFELLNKILPNDTWKEFKLESNTTITWESPIIIERQSWRYPYYPWYKPSEITYQNNIPTINTNNVGYLNQGLFNIEY
jgi:hypothetical protein